MQALATRILAIYSPIALLIFACESSDPQPAAPFIQSFEPTFAAPLALVTIEGTNFSSDPLQNDVRFNGLKGVVQSSTPTKIRAIVPSDALSGVISITVNGLTGVSSNTFTTNPLIGSWRINSASLTNCNDQGDNGLGICNSGCPTLTFYPTFLVYTSGYAFTFSYTLVGTSITIVGNITGPLGMSTAIYTVNDDQLTLLFYPPESDGCSYNETYVRL